MLDEGPAKAVVRLVTTGLKLEIGSEPGRINALLMAIGFGIVVMLGAQDSLVSIIKIWRPHYDAKFPWVAVIAIFMGGFLLCVLMLVLLAAFVVRSSKQPESGPPPGLYPVVERDDADE